MLREKKISSGICGLTIICAVTEDTCLSRRTISRAVNGFLPREWCFQRIRDMDTWYLCKFPPGVRIIGDVMWTKKKLLTKGIIISTTEERQRIVAAYAAPANSG